ERREGPRRQRPGEPVRHDRRRQGDRRQRASRVPPGPLIKDEAVKAGLVLSGGGATGAYEVGVLKALLLGHSPVTERRPLHLKSIAATSIGTFNASVLLSHHDGRVWDGAVAALESTWVDKISASRAISPNGVFRYRPNFLEWLDPSRWMRPWQPASLFAIDATYIARHWIAPVSRLASGAG